MEFVMNACFIMLENRSLVDGLLNNSSKASRYGAV